MSIETDLYDALEPLVAGRCYPQVFPLTPPKPTWPAIRYSIVSEVPAVAMCGDSEDEANDTRIQLDCVAQTFAEARALRLAVIAALVNFDPPCTRESSSMDYDAETQTFRVTMDYVFYPST